MYEPFDIVDFFRWLRGTDPLRAVLVFLAAISFALAVLLNIVAAILHILVENI